MQALPIRGTRQLPTTRIMRVSRAMTPMQARLARRVDGAERAAWAPRLVQSMATMRRNQNRRCVMIEVMRDDDVVILAPDGHYDQASFADAVERVATLCRGERAICLIMDFSRARGVERHSVVRIRETTRHLVQHAPSFNWRAAVVAPSDEVATAMNIGGVISRGQGIDYCITNDMTQARLWARSALSSKSQESASRVPM